MYGPFCAKQPEDVPMERKPPYEELEQRIKELENEIAELKGAGRPGVGPWGRATVTY